MRLSMYSSVCFIDGFTFLLLLATTSSATRVRQALHHGNLNPPPVVLHEPFLKADNDTHIDDHESPGTIDESFLQRQNGTEVDDAEKPGTHNANQLICAS